MNITIMIPDELIGPLHAAVGSDLSRAAVERLALEGYRAETLSRFQVQQLLGFDNLWDTEKWLGEQGARLQYGFDDLDSDRDTLNRLLGSEKS